MNTGLPESILISIINTLNCNENVIRAVIFGSRSRGDYKYNSDIDLAVYSNEKLPSELRFELDKAAGIYKIDVVDMNSSLDEKLRQRIEEQGIEIYRSKKEANT
jgi:predicted nucleotidyltransferase